MMSAPSWCCTCMEISGVKRCLSPLRCDLNQTPSSSTWARRSLPGATWSSEPVLAAAASMLMTFLKPEPRLITWKPPESVKVGPSQFMNLPKPPAASSTAAPGCRYRWYALASSACAPSSFMDSGSTALTVALVPTAMNAGVWISPCGVVMVPVRPWKPPPLSSIWAGEGLAVLARRLPTRKEKSDWGTPPFCPTPCAAGHVPAGRATKGRGSVARPTPYLSGRSQDDGCLKQAI